MAANSRSGQGTELPGDVVADILASEQRRAMLSCLTDAEGPVVVDDLAAACVREDSAGADAETGEVRADIYDRHLPKLTATGVVEYDSMCETVELVDEGIVPHLERSR